MYRHPCLLPGLVLGLLGPSALACGDAAVDGAQSDADGIHLEIAELEETLTTADGEASDLFADGQDTPDVPDDPPDLVSEETASDEIDSGGAADATSEHDAVGEASDTSDASSSDTPDGLTPCNLFGCACDTDEDCLDGLCVDHLDGRVCSERCTTTCPSEDFTCAPIALAGAPSVTMCVPRHESLCMPCRSDEECASALTPGDGARCVLGADPLAGSFCASACAEAGCPDGYTCRDVASAAGGSTRQCLPDAGLCSCRPAWSASAPVTDCARESAYGVCAGTRTCGAEGLTECDAPEAALETCNLVDDDCDGETDEIAEATCEIRIGDDACPGTVACEGGEERCVGRPPSAEACNLVDDDCDGQTDEDTCRDELACTDDVCVGDGACDNRLRPGFCLIDGVCVGENEPNPGFSCERCVPSRSTTSWTGAAGGQCQIDGECWPAGAAKPDDPCQRCRPEDSTTAWTAAPDDDASACDDGDPCTRDDTCAGGVCSGHAYACGDGKACTDDVCVGDGTCAHPIKNGQCLIEGICYADGERPDLTTCRVCRAEFATTWSAPDAALGCDDGLACTFDDRCLAATCAGTSYICDDQRACTLDSCDGAGGCAHAIGTGSCLIAGQCWQHGAVDPADPCHVCDGANPTAWSAVPRCKHCVAAGECTGVFDPIQDQCQVPDCVGGLCALVARDCVDDDACTFDGCDPHAGCYHRLEFAAAGSLSYQICPQPVPHAEADLACQDAGRSLASFETVEEAGDFDALVDAFELDLPWVASFSGVTCGPVPFRIPPPQCYVWDTSTEPACSVSTLCDELHPFVCQLDCDDADPCTSDAVDEETGACVHKAVPCGPAPGDTCAVAHTLTANVQASGDIRPSSGLSADHDAASCAGASPDGAASIDEAWVFTVPSTDAFLVTATPTSADADLIIYSFPAAGCETTCIQYNNLHGVGGDETIVVQPTSVGQVYYIVVDAVASDKGGAYTIRAYEL